MLTKKCNCDGHEERITINASNAVYDGNTHDAQLVYSDGTWDELVEFIHTKDDVVVANAINAGNYKVTLSYAAYSVDNIFDCRVVHSDVTQDFSLRKNKG